jgi:hypothetical protein
MELGDANLAIRLACKSRHLGSYRDSITKARQAIDTPDFYRSIGQDPERIVSAGVDAVAALCGEVASD